MIVLAPGSPLWSLAGHAGWLTGPVIRLTEGCALATPLLLLWAWTKPAGLRCVLAVALGLTLLLLAVRAVTAVSFVSRPFVRYGFEPLYPHGPSTSFPSFTTACFAVVATAVLCAWRRLGWVCVAITAEVAFGCVYVGVHYVTDVIAGAALGAASGAIAWLVLRHRLVARAVAAVDGILARAHLRKRPALTCDTS